MTSLIRIRALVPVFVVFLVLLAVASLANAGTPAPVRIKNGRGLKVVLGKTREAATGIRPEKNVWTLELEEAVVGADADLRDVTPDVAGARWSLPVATARLVLDEARFLPGHVYRLELRRERQLLGSALIYLYPPPTERASRVTFEDQPTPAPSDDGFAPATAPKGRL